MDETTIVNLLTNSGLTEIKVDNDFIYFQDPTCILPAFDTLLDYAWVVVLVLTGIIIFGWGILYIKNGVKLNDLFDNAKSLLLILITFSVAKPAVNVIYGDDLFAKQCEIKQVSRYNVQELLDLRKKKFGQSDQELFEMFDVIDSGVIYDPNTTPEDISTQTPVVPTSYTPSNDDVGIVSDFVSIETGNKTVIYVKSNGQKLKRSGGTVAWRNNNPGNIVAGTFTRSHGAIGQAGRFAVFPDEQTGMRAIKSLLRSNAYINLTISGAIHRWAPAADNNDPVRYTQHVSQITGLSANRVLNSLSDEELGRVANAIRMHEGWKPGIEQVL